MAIKVLQDNKISHLLIGKPSVASSEEKWAVWLMRDKDSGTYEGYRWRNDAKRDALRLGKWLDIPVWNEKRGGSLVLCPND